MQIKVLGCSGGIGPDLRTTSLLVDGSTLIDAGTGVGDLSLDDMAQIRRVFLTHSHLDHVCGLAFLADNLAGDVDQPIEVLATQETLAALRAHLFNWQLWPDFSVLPSAEAPMLRYVETALGSRHALAGAASLQSFEVRHSIPAVGYAVSGPRRVFAFTGDTGSCDAMWAYLNALPRLDYLMIDIAFPDEQAELGVVSRHYTPALLGREIAQLRHRPELLLTHHKPGCEALLNAQCATALAGWTYRHLQRGTVIEL